MSDLARELAATRRPTPACGGRSDAALRGLGERRVSPSSRQPLRLFICQTLRSSLSLAATAPTGRSVPFANSSASLLAEVQGIVGYLAASRCSTEWAEQPHSWALGAPPSSLRGPRPSQNSSRVLHDHYPQSSLLLILVLARSVPDSPPAHILASPRVLKNLQVTLLPFFCPTECFFSWKGALLGTLLHSAFIHRLLFFPERSKLFEPPQPAAGSRSRGRSCLRRPECLQILAAQQLADICWRRSHLHQRDQRVTIWAQHGVRGLLRVGRDLLHAHLWALNQLPPGDGPF